MAAGEKVFRALGRGPRLVAFGATLALLALLALGAGSAGAKGGGQIGEGFGTPGAGAGQFFNPAMFGVDSVDGSLYTGDLVGASSEGEAANYRIQKFTAGGEFKAAAEVKRYPATGKLASLHGLAVDHGLGRIYAIEGCRVAVAGGSLNCLGFGGKIGARKILVFSTTPEGTKLVPDATLPEIALPSGSEEIYEPQAIAVDPSSHDILVLGNENAKHRIIQRISSAGVLGARYTDTADKLKPAAGVASSLAVSPTTGIVYTMTGGQTPPSLFTRVWQLPANLSSLEETPGVSAAASKEDWINGLETLVEGFFGGPQLAISTDGSTLYWKEQIKRSEEAEAGELSIRAFSLTKGETVGLWGWGASRCKITSSNAALATTTGGNLAVLDTGQATKTAATAPAYGRKVYTFGPSGTGCKEPVAKFTINGKTEAETPTGINPGETVTFNASSSELAGGVRQELIWKFGDGQEKVVSAAKEGEDAAASVTHVYAAAGKYTPRLEIKLETPIYGNPDPKERTFNVGNPNPSFKLKVAKTGAGSGTVTSNPAGINCGADCEEEYEEGKEVELIPAPDVGSKFTGWSGACTGSGSCKVTLSAAKEVTANFALEQFALKVAKAGTGTGTVTSNPTGINCGADCEESYDFGTKVTLTPAAAANSNFVKWSGACTGSGACEVTVSAAKEVTAEFALKPKFKLKVTKSGAGSGGVTSNPAGINCGSSCEAEFEEGKEVELTPAPQAGSEFLEWTGACTGTGSCKVTMGAAKEVGAVFKLAQFQLEVKRSGTGTGSVSSNPSGIECGADCRENYDFGTKVTLTPAAAANSNFVKWSGACTGSGACEVTVSAAKEVTAEFALKPKFKLKVAKTGAGGGTVTSNPAGINCGSSCEAEFEEGKEVELSPSADSGSSFVKWTGACAGSGACKVTMGAAKEVTAEFKVNVNPSFKLKVAKTGAGSGTVTSNPAGINCGVDCEEEYEEGKEVELIPVPDAGSKFTGWSGACTGSGSCKVTLSAAKEVTASFALEQFALKVAKAGTGSGTVTSNPTGINCGADCEESYDFGTKVTLTPTPVANSNFVKWSGACTGSGACEVTVSAAKEVTAEFALKPKFKLKVTKSGAGSGGVASNPAGINCGSTCEAEFEEGKEVELTPAPQAGSEFLEWTGACTGTGSCKVTMGAAKEVGAVFKLAVKPEHQLKVTVTGSGTVTSNPAGINCPGACQQLIEEGKQVELKAVAATGSHFTGWSGVDCVSSTCIVKVTAAITVTAGFAADPPVEQPPPPPPPVEPEVKKPTAAEQLKKALKKCKKLKGKAKSKCIKRAKAKSKAKASSASSGRPR